MFMLLYFTTFLAYFICLFLAGEVSNEALYLSFHLIYSYRRRVWNIFQRCLSMWWELVLVLIQRLSWQTCAIYYKDRQQTYCAIVMLMDWSLKKIPSTQINSRNRMAFVKNEGALSLSLSFSIPVALSLSLSRLHFPSLSIAHPVFVLHSLKCTLSCSLLHISQQDTIGTGELHWNAWTNGRKLNWSSFYHYKDALIM